MILAGMLWGLQMVILVRRPRASLILMKLSSVYFGSVNVKNCDMLCRELFLP